MEGVTILNQYTNTTVFWIFLVILGVSIIIMLITYAFGSKFLKHLKIITYICIGLLFIGLIGSVFSLPIHPTVYYEVSISDEVHMKDFMNKYEVVKQKGQIYTIKERPQKEENTTEKEITTTEVR